MTLSDSDDTDTPMDKSYLKNKLKSFVSTSSDMKKEMENDRKGFESKLNNYRLELEKLQQTNDVLQKELEKKPGVRSKSRFDRFEAKPVQIECPPKRDQSPRGMSKDNASKLLESIRNYMECGEKDKGGEIQDTQRDTICKIFKNEYLQNTHNKSHTKSSFDLKCPDFIKQGDFEYSSEKVFDKQKTCHRQITELGSGDFLEFVNQFKYFDVSDLGELEFNNLIRMCLSKDQMQLISRAHINAMNQDTESYLTALNEILVGGDKSIPELEKSLFNYRDKSTNIMMILSQYEHMLQQFPPNYMTRESMEQRVIVLVTNYLPDHLISVLKERNSDKINGVLSLYAFKKFLQTHKNEINNFLVKNINKSSYVKKLKTISSPVSSNNNSDVEESCNNGARRKTIKKSSKNKHHTKDDKIDHSISKLNISNFENSIKTNDCISDISDDENIYKINASSTKKCNICMQNYHSPKECIFNPDPKIRNENINRIKLKSCLLCRLRTHVTINCPYFPDIGPIAPTCSNCEDNNIYQMHHPSSDCLKSNFLEKFVEKQNQT